MGERDLRMVALASQHHGVVTREELADGLGFGASSISRRVTRGELRSVRRGVYVVVAIQSVHSTVAALVRATERSVASHRSAAALHRMAIKPSTPTITVPKGDHAAIAGCRLVETRFLPAIDHSQVAGIDATTPARTLCDLAAELRPKHLRHLVQEQTLAARPSMPALIACHQALARRGRTGTVAMRAVLADLNDDEPYPSSHLELLVIDGLASRRLSGIKRQFAPPWYDGVQGIVDFADPTGRTIIEADGRAWHTLDRHAARDRARNRDALANGWVVIRVGWAELTERTDATLDELVAIVERRRSGVVQAHRRA